MCVRLPYLDVFGVDVLFSITRESCQICSIIIIMVFYKIDINNTFDFDLARVKKQKQKKIAKKPSHSQSDSKKWAGNGICMQICLRCWKNVDFVFTIFAVLLARLKDKSCAGIGTRLFHIIFGVRKVKELFDLCAVSGERKWERVAETETDKLMELIQVLSIAKRSICCRICKQTCLMK